MKVADVDIRLVISHEPNNAELRVQLKEILSKLDIGNQTIAAAYVSHAIDALSDD